MISRIIHWPIIDLKIQSFSILESPYVISLPLSTSTSSFMGAIFDGSFFFPLGVLLWVQFMLISTCVGLLILVFLEQDMALKRGSSGLGTQRNRSAGSSFPIVILIFCSFLAPLIFFVGRGLYTSTSVG